MFSKVEIMNAKYSIRPQGLNYASLAVETVDGEEQQILESMEWERDVRTGEVCWWGRVLGIDSPPFLCATV